MNEIEQVIEQEFSKTVKRIASKSPPKHTLAEILIDKTLNKLKELAKLHRISKYSTLKKDSLVSTLANALVELDRIETFLFMSDDGNLNELIELSKVSQLECSAITCAKLDFYMMLGMVEIYYFESKFIAVMPTEIRQIVEKVCTKDFMKKKKRDSLILNYARSCVSLYGIISQDEFVEIFNAQNSTPTDIDEVFTTLIKHVSMDSDFCFWDEYIVSAGFEEDDFEGVSHLIEATQGKPRYIPTKNQLLKYADSSYYEETIYTKKLERHLKTICKTDYIAEDLADEICFLASMEADFNDIMQPVNAAGIEFEGIEDVQAFADIIMDLKNNTRIWANKGHTPKELHSLYAKKPIRSFSDNLIPFNTFKNPAPVASKKVGRNEPCPCGSGKKYKKCCGK
ncbi:SEC-C metal-binding domain-containing protein [Bengtsoniella intestinalis]|uniref:SEC-C metal-binding domain-containing protein n=1 Tax=Bengtsoniella intestinalis TaxID=3073143 RepID=UPI00391F6357